MTKDKAKDEEASGKGRWIGMRFDCCGGYQRIYLNRERTAFVGWCPRCAKRVRVKVSKSGSRSRFFVAN